MMFNSFISSPPKTKTNFVAFYSDGSGAAIFCWRDGSIRDAEGDYVCCSDETAETLFEMGYDRWLPLPDDFQFWFMQRVPIMKTKERE